MEFDKISEEALDKVSGGMTEERKKYLDTYIERCKIQKTPLKTALQVLSKNGASLEDITYVTQNW